MTKKRILVVRVTKNQHERIKNNANAKGFTTVSAYIRSLALESGLSTEMKINEIHNKVTEIHSKIE